MNSKSSSSSLLSVDSAAASATLPDHRLTFRTRHRDGVVILSVHGQADAFTLSLWRQTVREAADTAAKSGGALIVDAGRLDFLSLRTLGALVEDAARFLRDGVRTCLVTTDLRIARLLAEDPRTALLTVRSTVVSAHTALEAPMRSAPPTVAPDDTAEASGGALSTRRRRHGPSSAVIPISARKAVAAGVRR
ncbi:hypothetical protein IU449_01125 [Nocardia higoensis]|uniref:STAS domain-containing protein n=1 Tax=Nocardia higoensis TaxID=228599 RepID=A0ABS0D3U5_9NOCA|nr:STAS domain-containing protein [Nocardia higoensis]MBF6353164.1 hypothetical protein [Nocardia higoensis]